MSEVASFTAADLRRVRSGPESSESREKSEEVTPRDNPMCEKPSGGKVQTKDVISKT